MYIPDKLARTLLRCKPSIVKVVLWLIDNADEDGTLDTSFRKLAGDVGVTFQEARTAIAWCVSNTVANTVTNTQLTHVTIIDIDTYRQLENTANTPANTVSNTLKGKENKQKENSPTTPTKKEKDKEKENSSIKGAKKNFVPPTIEEIRTYITEKGYDINPEEFWSFYESKNWMIGKNKMSQWKRAVVTWVTRKQQNSNNNGRNSYSEERQQRDDWFADQARAAFEEVRTRDTTDNLPF